MRTLLPKHGRSGFLLADVLLGLMLLATLGTVLAMSLNLRQRAALRLARQREATQMAQQVLLALESDGKVPAIDPNMNVKIARTGLRAGEYEWVEVTVVHETSHVALVGLARPTTQPGVLP